MNLITANDLAKRLNITRQAVQYHLRKGLLDKPAITIGNVSAWTEEQVAVFLKRRRPRNSKASLKEVSKDDIRAQEGAELGEVTPKPPDPFDAPF